MSDAPSLRILVLPAKPFPCDHPMLESVFATRLPAAGHSVAWVMRSDLPGPGPVSWRASSVFLAPSPSGGLMSTALARLRYAAAVLRAARRVRPHVVVVRNSIGSGLLGLWLRARSGSRLCFQVSFPTLELRREQARAGRSNHGRIRAAASGTYIL